MQLDVDRADLRRMRAVDLPTLPLSPGQVRLRIDHFGFTANNITYAVFGDAMGYWGFFPGPEEAGAHWGRIPVWGFADVVETTVAGVAESTRVYGYFPMADELVVEPGRIDDRGFTDLAAHRQPLPSVYNRYSLTGTDPVYRADREAQQMLLWPLFVTSFVVDDFLADHQLFDSTRVVISSASAKTSIAAAYLLSRREGVEVIGLTSDPNLDFVRSLGCYHSVVPYGAVDTLPAGRACYVDVAGRRAVTAAVHTRLGADLVYSMIVGDTHWEDDAGLDQPLDGPRPVFLFAPDQITRRRRQWGRDGFEQAVADAWNRFSPWTDLWLTVRRADGPAEVETVYRDVLEGRVDPRRGDVCTLVESRFV